MNMKPKRITKEKRETKEKMATTNISVGRRIRNTLEEIMMTQKRKESKDRWKNPIKFFRYLKDKRKRRQKKLFLKYPVHILIEYCLLVIIF